MCSKPCLRTFFSLAYIGALCLCANTVASELVVGWDNWACHGDQALLFRTVQEACDDGNVVAYQQESDDFSCRLCENDPPPIAPSLPRCPPGQHPHGSVCHRAHVCGEDQIGGGDADCEDCGDNSGPNSSGTACVCDDGYEDTDGDGNCTELCSQGVLDGTARSSLLPIPREPWERGEPYSCSGGAASVDSNNKTSSKERYRFLDYPTNSSANPGSGDVCRVAIPIGGNTAAAGHSHPHFVWNRDWLVICGGSPLRNRQAVRDANDDNRSMAPDDKAVAQSAQKPLYLVVPERDHVKVYRKNDRGSWRVERL